MVARRKPPKVAHLLARRHRYRRGSRAPCAWVMPVKRDQEDDGLDAAIAQHKLDPTFGWALEQRSTSTLVSSGASDPARRRHSPFGPRRVRS